MSDLDMFNEEIKPPRARKKSYNPGGYIRKYAPVGSVAALYKLINELGFVRAEDEKYAMQLLRALDACALAKVQDYYQDLHFGSTGHDVKNPRPRPAELDTMGYIGIFRSEKLSGDRELSAWEKKNNAARDGQVLL